MSVSYTQSTLAQLKQNIRSLAKLPRNQGWLDLSRKLYQLHRRDSAEFYALIQEGTLKRRTAYYLRNVGQLIRTAKLSTSQTERIGWTKLQIIGEKVNSRNVARFLKLAEENNAQELKRLIRHDNAKPKPHCVLLYFTDREYVHFETAIRREGAHRKGRGLIGKEAAIMRIIRHSGTRLG